MLASGAKTEKRETMIQDPEQVFSFAFVCGCVCGYAFARLRDVVRRMDDRDAADRANRQALRMREWDK